MKTGSAGLLITLLFISPPLVTPGCKKQPQSEQSNAPRAHRESTDSQSRIRLPVDFGEWELVASEHDVPRLEVSPISVSFLICEDRHRYEYRPSLIAYSAVIKTSEPYNGFLVQARFGEELDRTKGEGLEFGGAKLCFSEAPYEVDVLAQPKGLRIGGHADEPWRYVGRRDQHGFLFFPPIPDSVTDVLLKIPCKRGGRSKAFTFRFRRSEEPENRVSEQQERGPVDFGKWELADSNCEAYEAGWGTVCWRTSSCKCLWPLKAENLAGGEWEYRIPLGIIVLETQKAYNGFYLDWRGPVRVNFGALWLYLPDSNYELNVVEEPDGLRLNGSELQKPWGHTEKGYSWGVLFFPPIPDSVKEVLLKMPYRNGQTTEMFTFTFRFGGSNEE